MNSITALKDQINTKTFSLVMLSIASAGIFPLMWLYRHGKSIERITSTGVASDTFLAWLAVSTGLGGALGALAGPDDAALSGVGVLLQLASAVLWVVWAFRARSALQAYVLNVHRAPLPMNRLYTVLFHVFYINHCINDLPEIVRRHTITTTPAVGPKEPT